MFFKDSGNKNPAFMDASASKFIEDGLVVLGKGLVFAEATYGDGSTEERFIGENLVVSTAGNIIAQLCRGYTGGDPTVNPAVTGVSDGPAIGITHMALGDVGPVLNPDPPSLSDTSLGNEYTRKAITQSQYVNEVDGTQSALPTRVVDFITFFDKGEAQGALTEVGLIGGVDSSGLSGSSGGGILFSRRTFPVWNIDSQTTITFTWRIIF